MKRMAARRALELDLRGAPSGGQQLEVYYQPLIDLNHNRLSGFEALLRWHHPERGHGAARRVSSRWPRSLA